MIIGLTGGFGTGKSTVARMFAKLGAKILDADRIVHSFIGFSARKDLAKIVFRRRAYLDLLCKVIHPLVIRKIKEEIKRMDPKKSIIVIDAPLLIEAGLHRIVDKLVVVKTKKETQIKRSIKRTGLKKSEILRRIRLQIPLKKKIKLADFVIDNDGPLSTTREQAIDIWKRFDKTK
jgi:dephospho-CoA kinase